MSKACTIKYFSRSAQQEYYHIVEADDADEAVNRLMTLAHLNEDVIDIIHCDEPILLYKYRIHTYYREIKD